MDYQVRLLELSERCRALSAPSAYTDVIASCARILDTPIRGFQEFVDEYIEVVDALPRLLEHVTGRLEVPRAGPMHLRGHDFSEFSLRPAGRCIRTPTTVGT